MRRLCALLAVVAGCSGFVVAQQLPSIVDVYSSGQAADRQGLGPTGDPAEVLDRFLERMQGTERVRYDVHVAYQGEPKTTLIEARGTVTLGKSPLGVFNRFRIDVTGEVPDGGTLDATVGSTGSGYYLMDRQRRTITEFDAWDESTPVGRLVLHMLITGPDGDWLHSAADRAPVLLDSSMDDTDPRYTVHFVDVVRGEHLYVALSQQDMLPRSIERVTLGADGRPSIVSTRFINLRLEPRTPDEFFAPVVPDGFRRVGREHAEPAD